MSGVGVGYHRFARANAESTLPLLARCVIASSVSAPRIACNIFFFVRRMRISTFNERRSVSDIIKRSSPTRATSTTTASDTARHTTVARARPDVVSRASTRFFFHHIRQFLFFSRSLCVLDALKSVSLFFSLVHSQSPTAASARVSKDTLDAEQDLRNVNDPSAGSPTETLLRLLLPLNDQVWSSSRQHRQCRDIAAHQSEDLTKSFNR